MIDTVILNIPKSRYQILNKDKFTPSARFLDEVGYYNISFVNNPTLKDKNEGRYLPRLTIRKRGNKGVITQNLKIEFSVPKLLYGNNLEEVSQNDFEELIKRLKSALLYIGVFVSEDDLKNADVSAFHPSKNIVLSEGYTSSFVIQELAKVNLTKKLDLTKTGFRNEGKALQYYSNAYSIVFYDKISDLNQPKGRAVDKDQTSMQTSIFDEIQESKQKLEILRFEVRITKKQKMNSLLKELNFKINPSFSDLFSQNLCQKVLQHFWQNFVVAGNEFLLEPLTKPLSLLKVIMSTNSCKNSKQAIYFLGLALLCKEDGIRELRQIIESTSSKRTWQRFDKDIGRLNLIISKSPLKHSYFTDIEESLKNMNPYRIIRPTKIYY